MYDIIQLFFEEQAAKIPDKPAFIFRDEAITYGELNNRSNQLSFLLRKKGVGSNTIIGVLMERSIEMIVCIMAILKAGGAYLPLSPSYPAQRLSYILEDSHTRIILTSHRGFEQYKGILACDILVMDTIDITEVPTKNPDCLNIPTDLVYVIYTSGSTGKPKGVMIEHRSLVNRIHWMQEAYPLDSTDTIMQKTPFTFDVSVWELFWWSTVGAKVCMLEPGMEKFPKAIIEVAEKNQVTVMHFVPSMLNAFLQYIEQTEVQHRLKSLRQVFVSGEALTAHHVMKFNAIIRNNFGTRLTNLYGPTEATIDVSFYDCPVGIVPPGNIPIGRAIHNTELFVIGKDLRTLPQGELGELCISGVGLARGYINNQPLTDERFMYDHSGKRFYRTGDLALIRPDGLVEFHGRIDNQVKLRGLRIELGEIEACALSCDGIEHCTVIVEADSDISIRLIAFYVAQGEEKGQALKQHLKSYLPDYMLPAKYVKLDKPILTDNGKVNRKALQSWRS